MPGVSDTRAYVFDREPVTNIDIPAQLADGWTYVEMPVNTLNIISYLNGRGVNLNAYNLIFVELNYRIIRPTFDSGPGAGPNVANGIVAITYAPYADQPPIIYLTDEKEDDDGLIINSDFSVDPDSYPIHNLLKQLDRTNTTFIGFTSTSSENITSGTSLTSSSTNQTKLQNALNKAYNKRAKIVCSAAYGGSQYIQLTEDASRRNDTPVPGAGCLIARVDLNRKYKDWSLRNTIRFSYYSYLTSVYDDDDLDLSGLPVGYENAFNYDTTYGPYYSSVINRRTI